MWGEKLPLTVAQRWRTSSERRVGAWGWEVSVCGLRLCWELHLSVFFGMGRRGTSTKRRRSPLCGSWPILGQTHLPRQEHVDLEPCYLVTCSRPKRPLSKRFSPPNPKTVWWFTGSPTFAGVLFDGTMGRNHPARLLELLVSTASWPHGFREKSGPLAFGMLLVRCPVSRPMLENGAT